MTKEKFIVTVESPYGDRPAEQFYKHMKDLASESLQRWGIEVSISRVDDAEEPTEDFD